MRWEVLAAINEIETDYGRKLNVSSAGALGWMQFMPPTWKQYGVRWEVLAAINEIETDYGRNLNVSTAGAVGWMQFLPSTWRAYGVDANKDGKRDPYNPVDAIFGAARYLKAAGYQQDEREGIFAYNHADWYVDSVMMRARQIAGIPSDLTGSLTGPVSYTHLTLPTTPYV